MFDSIILLSLSFLSLSLSLALYFSWHTRMHIYICIGLLQLLWFISKYCVCFYIDFMLHSTVSMANYFSILCCRFFFICFIYIRVYCISKLEHSNAKCVLEARYASILCYLWSITSNCSNIQSIFSWSHRKSQNSRIQFRHLIFFLIFFAFALLKQKWNKENIINKNRLIY